MKGLKIYSVHIVNQVLISKYAHIRGLHEIELSRYKMRHSYITVCMWSTVALGVDKAKGYSL